MNYLINKVLSVFKTAPSNAFLLFSSGFLFAQLMLLNVLYTRHPQGGWATDLGIFSTPFVLIMYLLALTFCLVALWRSTTPSND